MPNTTPVFATLPSVDPALLLLVSGGCHKRSCPPPAPPAPVLQQQIMQPILPQAAPPPAQPAADPGPSTVVTTNVSINGKPVA